MTTATIEKYLSTETGEIVTPSDSPRSASQSAWVDLLPDARRNGVRRHVQGLIRFAGRFTAYANGDEMTEIETAGRELDDPDVLMEFAYKRLTVEGTMR